MGFLSRLRGEGPAAGDGSESDTSAPESDKSATELRVVQGVEVPVGRGISEFARTRLAGAPAGLLVPMKDFVLTQGELLSTWGTDRFNISADQGPCRLVCAGCDAVFSEQFVFSCGSNSAAAAFGMPSHTECSDCGSSEAIIVYLPDREFS